MARSINAEKSFIASRFAHKYRTKVTNRIFQNRATNRFDARAQHERGDAGDSINITDTTLLSVASVNNDDFESIMKLARDDVTTEDIRSIETNNRYLWKVLEEDDDDI